MDNLPSTATGAINLGAIAHAEGRLADARTLFAHALHLEPDNERAWLWYATVAEDPAEQRYCLNRALEINPESRGLQRLVALPRGPMSVPDELRQVDEPPLPPDLEGSHKVPLPLFPRSAVERRQRARQQKSSGQGQTAQPDGDGTATATAQASSPWLRIPRWLPLVTTLLLIVIAVAFFRWSREPRAIGDSYHIAFVGPLSGPNAVDGQEQLWAIQMALDAINADGGIDGIPVTVQAFDDQDNPDIARQRAAEIVADPQVLLVIGHKTSEASLAAAPIYRDAGLPAITASATADALTENTPWYFRSIFTNGHEGALIANYAQHALGYERASVISTESVYESTLASAFVDTFAQEGTVVHQWTIDSSDIAGSVANIATELQASANPGVVILALRPPEAREMLVAMRRAEIDVPIIGGEAIGYFDFPALFANEPEELEKPGFFTNGMYVASPLIYDSLGGDALAFAERFVSIHGVFPRWYGAKAHDAATLALAALPNAIDEDVASPDIAAIRRGVQERLAAIDSLDVAAPGLSGPLYFNASNTVPQSLSFGLFDRGSLQSAPIQYRAVSESAVDLTQDRAEGLVFDIAGQPFLQYRVAYVGVDLNEVTNLNLANQTFQADFFLWFRYQGDESIENVFFPNSTTPSAPLPDPIDRRELDDDRFTMYRIDGSFTDPLNFANYPWDRHTLTINMQNTTLSQDDIVYVPDQATLRESQAERQHSGANINEPFNRIANWIVQGVYFLQDTAIVRSTTPDPETGAPGYRQVSTYQVQIDYARDVRAFLIKNMLPLALLALVTYFSIYFAPANATTRISLAITSVLTASVMLQSVWNSLPNVGYTVAIEWLYYVYIGLSAALVLISITVDRWYKAKRLVAARQLDLIAQIGYPAVLIIVITAYALRFG